MEEENHVPVVQISCRQRVVQEVLSTENSYRKSLEILKVNYVNPLRMEARKIPAILSLSEVNTLFSDVDAVCRISDKLLEEMEQVGDELDMYVGKIFSDIAPLFKLYTSYVNSHHRALEMHRLLMMTRPQYKDFIETRASACGSPLSLDSFLILPVQRVPRYELLLKELLKQTEATHPEHPVLTSALNKVSSVAAAINDNLADFEKRTKVLAIQEKFAGTVQLVAPQRWYIREGMLRKVCKRKPKTYLFVLFNDILIYGEALNNLMATKTYRHHRTVELETADCYACENSSIGEPQFLVSSPSKSFKVVCVSVAERDLWVEDILRNIDSTRKRQNFRTTSSREMMLRRKTIAGVPTGCILEDETEIHAPVKHHGTQASQCDLCHASFNYIRRRKVCNRCGITVCEKCSPHKLLVGKSRQRVCSICFLQEKNEGLTLNFAPNQRKSVRLDNLNEGNGVSASVLGRRSSAPLMYNLNHFDSEESSTNSMTEMNAFYNPSLSIDSAQGGTDHSGSVSDSPKSPTGESETPADDSSSLGGEDAPPPLPPKKCTILEEVTDHEEEEDLPPLPPKNMQNPKMQGGLPTLPPKPRGAFISPQSPDETEFLEAHC